MRVKHRWISRACAVFTDSERPEMTEKAAIASMYVFPPGYRGICLSHSTKKSLGYSSESMINSPSQLASGLGVGSFGLTVILCASRYSKNRSSSLALSAETCGKSKRRCSLIDYWLYSVGRIIMIMLGSTFFFFSFSYLFSLSKCSR